MKVKELKEFIEDLDDNIEVVAETIISGDENYCSEINDITYSKDYNSGEELLVLYPKEVSINNVVEDEEVDELADYLIENASEAFEHQDRNSLITVLKNYGKWM